MKNLIYLSLLFFSSLSVFAGGTTPTTPPAACNTASPFCTGTTYNFPNSTGVADLGGGGIYDCLSSTPNPVWYFMQIGTSGSITIDISQETAGGSPIDVDFVMWGPFTSLAAGCAGISTSNVVDCSYSTAASEQANISNAVAGQFYILLMTNYSDTPGSITFSQTSGTGSTNCNVLCNMTALSATPGACDIATGQYSVTGQITFQYPPTSGTLTVSSSCGTSVNIPGPWISPMSYTMPGLTANGAACTLTAAFSADATCTLTQNFTAPASCNCSVTAGNSGPVCPGSTVDLTATTVVGASGYSWTGPNGFASSSQNPTAVPVPTTPGSYTYNLTVAYGGQPCTSSTTVVVNNPVVNAGVDQTICAGDPVTLSGSGATTYSWDNGVTDGVVFYPTTTTTYTVIGTSTICSATDQVVVTVNTLPIVNAGNDVALCDGDAVTLTGSGGTTWTNGVTNGVSFVPVLTTTYTLTGTSNGCTSTDDVVVTVNPLPIANAGADQAVCNGISVTLTGSGGTSSWSGGITDGVAFTPNVTTTYTLTVVDANQCVATDDVIVTVNSTSIINAGSDQTVCSGTAVTLSGSGGTSYTWNNGVQDGVSFVPAVGTVTYTATDNNPTGCSGSDQVTVTVNPLPTVNAGNDTLICYGVSIALVGQGAASYTWDNNVTNGIAFVPQASATYNVTGIDVNGCQGTDQVTISVTPTPLVSFTPSVTSGCVPVTVTYTNTNPTNNTYQWSLGNGVTATNPNSVTTTYTGVGCYDVTLISTTPNGCVGQTTIPSIVCANANPVAGFTTNPSDLTLMDTYTQLLNETTGASSYIWYFGDGSPSSTDVNPSHTFPSSDPASYQITLIAISAFGCTDTSKVNIEVQDALIYYIPNSFTPDEDEHNPVFKPIFTSGFDPMDYKMEIFDRWGELIFETHDVEYGWDGTYNGTNGLVKEGTYVWKIEFKTTRSDERKKIIGSVTLLR